MRDHRRTITIAFAACLISAFARSAVVMEDGQRLTSVDIKLPPKLVERELTGVMIWPDVLQAQTKGVKAIEIESVWNGLGPFSTSKLTIRHFHGDNVLKWRVADFTTRVRYDSKHWHIAKALISHEGEIISK